MKQADYEAMTREELKNYVRKNRTDKIAWSVFARKNSEVQGKVFPYTDSLEETEAQLRSILELKKESN